MDSRAVARKHSTSTCLDQVGGLTKKELPTLCKTTTKGGPQNSRFEISLLLRWCRGWLRLAIAVALDVRGYRCKRARRPGSREL